MYEGFCCTLIIELFPLEISAFSTTYRVMNSNLCPLDKLHYCYIRLLANICAWDALLVSTLTPLFLPSSSVSLSYFILAVCMRECLGEHSCMSSPFPIAILNGSFFFRETAWSKVSKSRLSKSTIISKVSFPKVISKVKVLLCTVNVCP